MKFLSILMTFLLIPMMANAEGSIHIKDAFIYETKASMPAAAGFMTVMNHGDTDDKFIDFKTDIAARTELHTMTHENEIMKMRKVDGYVVKGDDGVVTLEPTGNHIMFFGLTKDLVAGDEIKATAIFEKAGEVPVTIPVQSRGQKKMMNHGGNHHHY